MPQPPKQIVNLAAQPERREPQPKKPDPLDEMYRSGNGKTEEPIKRINRPNRNPAGFDMSKILAGLAIIAIITAGAYFFFVRDGGGAKAPDNGDVAAGQKPGWYMLKLTDGEIFYGQIQDLSANPLKAQNVYYNYDKDKTEDEAETQASGLRLVKRGKEAHGPSGEIVIYQAQIVFLEPLREDSKVLQAIKDYEK